MGRISTLEVGVGMEMKEFFKTEGAEKRDIPAPLLNVKDVAITLGIAPKTVNKLVREGKLACVQVTSRDRRFTIEQVQAYIDSQTVEVRIDRQKLNRVRSQPPKGGEKSLGVSRTSLLEEMSQWQ
jgi:excisionase family DNA binding protein